MIIGTIGLRDNHFCGNLQDRSSKAQDNSVISNTIITGSLGALAGVGFFNLLNNAGSVALKVATKFEDIAPKFVKSENLGVFRGKSRSFVNNCKFSEDFLKPYVKKIGIKPFIASGIVATLALGAFASNLVKFTKAVKNKITGQDS
jgi:hypothetical protein